MGKIMDVSGSMSRQALKSNSWKALSPRKPARGNSSAYCGEDCRIVAKLDEPLRRGAERRDQQLRSPSLSTRGTVGLNCPNAEQHARTGKHVLAKAETLKEYLTGADD